MCMRWKSFRGRVLAPAKGVALPETTTVLEQKPNRICTAAGPPQKVVASRFGPAAAIHPQLFIVIERFQKDFLVRFWAFGLAVGGDVFLGSRCQDIALWLDLLLIYSAAASPVKLRSPVKWRRLVFHRQKRLRQIHFLEICTETLAVVGICP